MVRYKCGSQPDNQKKELELKKFGVLGVLILLVSLALIPASVQANPHANQSVNVAIIGSPGVINGGSLPTAGPVGELGDFTFSNLAPGAVNAANLAAFDTAVLNVASTEMGCTTATLLPPAKTDLVAFVALGHKLIIYDSECPAADYSWLPFPFTTSNPGAMGATGTLTIVEENTLSETPALATHFIDAANLGALTDAVGDMNVMMTLDPNWCIDMSGTNILGNTGPVHTYARSGLQGSVGLIIYNGLDVDFLGFEPSPPAPNGLRKIWAQELQQPFNPDGLPCSAPVTGIAIDPPDAENPAGTDHTVTATVTDLLGGPVGGMLVSFEVTGGPNTGVASVPNSGDCTANGDCTTDNNGTVSWTYTGSITLGTDTIEACFSDVAGNVLCADAAKDWIDGTPPEAVCVETVNPGGKNVPKAPGKGGQGQNQDGFYELNATDNVDPNPDVFLVDTGDDNVFGTGDDFTYGPFASGTKMKYTEANGVTRPDQKPGPGAIDWRIKGNGDAAVFATDAAGNMSPVVSCLVPPPPK